MNNQEQVNIVLIKLKNDIEAKIAECYKKELNKEFPLIQTSRISAFEDIIKMINLQLK
jgi:hypothetical protein